MDWSFNFIFCTTAQRHDMFWGSLWMILVDKLVFFCFLRNHNESKVFLLVCVVCQPITGIEFDSYSKQYTEEPGRGDWCWKSFQWIRGKALKKLLYWLSHTYISITIYWRFVSIVSMSLVFKNVFLFLQELIFRYCDLHTILQNSMLLGYCLVLQSKHLAYTESKENTRLNYILKKCGDAGLV